MILGFLAGLFLGGSVATIVISLLVAASRADEAMTVRPLHPCGPRCAPLAGLHRDPWA